MQLGELQNQIERFQRRNTSIIAISVDSPTDSLAMIERLGLSFDLLSDPEQNVVMAFGVQNPDTRELALHAVYIVDEQGDIFYRKVARRRPVSAELIDAIDAHAGLYPRHDRAAPTTRIAVAYPQNEFQALIELASVSALPAAVDRTAFADVQALLAAGRSDDAVFAFKRMIQASADANRDALFATAAWLIRQRFYPAEDAPMHAGLDLRRRLNRVTELEQQERAAVANGDAHDEVLHTLAAARAGLTRVRANISNHSQEWNLRYAKSSLRGYREVVRAATLQAE